MPDTVKWTLSRAVPTHGASRALSSQAPARVARQLPGHFNLKPSAICIEELVIIDINSSVFLRPARQ